MGKMISVSTSGDLDSVSQRLMKRQDGRWILAILERYGNAGVSALRAATPVESGETAAAWYFTVGSQDGKYYIDFHNSHVEDGVPIAIILDYGHGTGTGGWVQGKSFIMDAVRPTFEKILADVRKEVAAT